jgi:hypothetical protein
MGLSQSCFLAAGFVSVVCGMATTSISEGQLFCHTMVEVQTVLVAKFCKLATAVQPVTSMTGLLECVLTCTVPGDFTSFHSAQ